VMRWRYSLPACRAWWRSSGCRAGAGPGLVRSASWFSPWTPMPPASSNGGRWRGRRRRMGGIRM
jgi:hypothetical protein